MEEQKTELKIIRMSEVESQEVKWLWYPFIPYGKLTIIQGDPGDGKLQGGIAIASSDVRRIKSISVNAESVMTIENKTSFQRLRNGKFAMTYLGGFANRDQIEFLKKVISDIIILEILILADS